MEKFRKTFAIIAAIMSAILLAMTFFACTAHEADEPIEIVKEYTSIPGLDREKKVAIKIAIPNENDKALTLITNSFMKEYPNVNVSLEYMENYNVNAVEKFKEGSFDVIFTRDIEYEEEIVKDSATSEEKTVTSEDFYYNFINDPDIDFTNTNDTVSANYTHVRYDTDGNEITYMYSMPLGGEVRGVFVNKTLLTSLGLTIPKNYPEFLSCCQTLKDNGYIPIQGNPSSAGRSLGMPDSFRDIVNNPTSLEKLKNAEEGVSELFTDTFNRLYELACKRYYDYKYVEEELGLFKNSGDTAQAMDFLGLVITDDFEIIKPENNIGNVAFYPYISSYETLISTLIENNGLDTEIEFICPPLNDEGKNSAVYFTPYYGININKNSENLIWLRELVNYLFANIKTYSQYANIIPNSPDAIDLLASRYGVDKDTDCVLCGTIYFSDDYNASDPVSLGLVDVFKCSAPKYMVIMNKDENGNIIYSVDDDGNEYLPLSNGKEGTAEETKIYREFIGEEDPLRPGYGFCNVKYYLGKLEDYIDKYR